MTDDVNLAEPRRWRPQPLWILAGLLAGAGCGAAAAVALLGVAVLGDGGVDPDSIVGLIVIGGGMFGMYGGMCGAGVGLGVGLLMTFVGGSHLAVPQARRRAFVVTSVSTCAILFRLLVPAFDYSTGVIVIAVLAPVAGGSLSYWLASRLAV